MLSVGAYLVLSLKSYRGAFSKEKPSSKHIAYHSMESSILSMESINSFPQWIEPHFESFNIVQSFRDRSDILEYPSKAL
jgi:hypothetical protein